MAQLRTHRNLHRGEGSGADLWAMGPTGQWHRGTGRLAGGVSSPVIAGDGRRGHGSTQGDEAVRVG